MLIALEGLLQSKLKAGKSQTAVELALCLHNRVPAIYLRGVDGKVPAKSDSLKRPTRSETVYHLSRRLGALLGMAVLIVALSDNHSARRLNIYSVHHVVATVPYGIRRGIGVCWLVCGFTWKCDECKM